MIGHFVHKYQLLYAMEHRQHSTGKGWTMMCDRVIVGVVLFQLTLAGQLALRKAFRRAVLIAPLVIATLWFAYVYGRTYRPLMKYIALRSLRHNSDLGRDVQEDALAAGGNAPEQHQTVDEARERDLRFEHPSLVMRQAILYPRYLINVTNSSLSLDGVWILDKYARSENNSEVRIE